jgi:hypothetical protein
MRKFFVFTAQCLLSGSTGSFGPWSIGFGFRTYMIRKPLHVESFRLFHKNWPMSMTQGASLLLIFLGREEHHQEQWSFNFTQAR